MKNFVAVIFVSSAFVAFSAEQCPVEKISLARMTTCEALTSLKSARVDDLQLDSACLKLGRTTAILLRTAGEPIVEGAPKIDPEKYKWKEVKAPEIEGFCGVGKNTTLTRGMKNPDYVLSDDGIKKYLRDLVGEMNSFIAENKDVTTTTPKCNDPRPLPEHCLD
jgi:hypothetical protein